MGMMIGKTMFSGTVSTPKSTTTTTTTKVGNTIKKVTTIKNARGETIASFSVAKTDKSKSKSKKKRLQYNFKDISSQIMKAKTSENASMVVTKAKGKVAMLLKKLKSGEYDDEELEMAIAHAKKIERIARKRQKHLQEEEKAQQNVSNPFELEEDFDEETEEPQDTQKSQELELSEEELKELMQELQKIMQESMEEMQDAAEFNEEFTEELTGTIQEDVEPEDLERLKKKHRSDELREIAQADMKYLKALFDKLQKEKEANSSSNSLRNFSNEMSGVSLQLDGMNVPVETAAPVETTGESIDVSI